MVKKHYYTIWIRKEGIEEAILLEQEAVYKTFRRASKRAREIAMNISDTVL